MRLAAISVFFLTFAVTVWVAKPTPSSQPGFEAIGPLSLEPADREVPAVPEPDLPQEPLDTNDIEALNDCANGPDSPPECRVISIRRLFTHYLRPPADASRVLAVLRSPWWLAEAEIRRFEALAGWVPGNLGPGKQTFWVEMRLAGNGAWARLLVRVSGLPEPTPDDVRAFFSGEITGERVLQIEEFAWLDYDSNMLVVHCARHRVTNYFGGREAP
jgi:hypothetical protein